MFSFFFWRSFPWALLSDNTTRRKKITRRRQNFFFLQNLIGGTGHRNDPLFCLCIISFSKALHFFSLYISFYPSVCVCACVFAFRHLVCSIPYPINSSSAVFVSWVVCFLPFALSLPSKSPPPLCLDQHLNLLIDNLFLPSFFPRIFQSLHLFHTKTSGTHWFIDLIQSIDPHPTTDTDSFSNKSAQRGH